MPRKKQQIKIVDGLAETLEAAVETIKSCETNVVKCWQEMALAVKAIHTKRLWEGKYETFDDCMASEIGWKKSWAYEMLKAAEVLEDAPITDASMARFLHPLEPEKRLIAWEGAVSEAAPAKPTRDDVKKAAAMLRAGKSDESGAPDFIEDVAEPEEVKETGNPSLVPSVGEFDRIMGLMREVKSSIEELCEDKAGIYVTKAQVLADMKNAYNALAWAKPHCICVYCEGDGCKHCQQNGWLCKGLWASAPEEYKR